MSALKRLGLMVATLFAASVVIFIALELAPGDVARFMMGLEADEASVAALRDALGLGGSPIDRYARWMTGLITGDFGISYTYRVPVATLVRERISLSFPLAIGAFALSLIAGAGGAVLSVSAANPVSALLRGASHLGIAIPNFWLAMMLMLTFAVVVPVLPAGGFPGWGEPVSALKALVLPVCALAIPQAAILLRLLRTSLLEQLEQPFIRTARAKGLTQRQVMWRHAFPNAVVPVLPIIGLQLAFLVGGAVIIENVFFLPGLGRLILQAVTQRDLITVKSVIMLLVAMVVLISFSVDILSAWLDPRLRGHTKA